MSQQKKNQKRITQKSKPEDNATENAKPEYHQTPLDKRRALFITIYTLVVFTVAMASMLSIWPRTTSELANDTMPRSITFLGLGRPVILGPEILLASAMILAGIVGACVYSLYVISLHLGPYKDFDREWTAWYVLRPPIGAGMAFIVYVLVRGGILTVGADLENLNLLGLAGISFLVGLFSEHAMTKLLDLADTTFGKPPDKPADSSANKDTAQKT
jgi:hypothetical protein